MQNHSNPTLSVLLGSVLGISNFIMEQGLFIDNFFQLCRVIVFGIIGGVFGYFGKIVAIKIHKSFIKKQS